MKGLSCSMAKKYHFFGLNSPIKTPLLSVSKAHLLIHLSLTGLGVMLGEYPVKQASLVEVALESSVALKEAVEKYGQIFVILQCVLWYLEPHGCREAL
jgi:hypothetical protein